MLNWKTALLGCFAFVLFATCSVSAAEFKEVPNDLKAFLSNLHENATNRNLGGLAGAVHMYFGLNVESNVIGKNEILYLLEDNEPRVFQFFGEGETWTKKLTLSELLFGENRIFGMCSKYDLSKSFMMDYNERWSQAQEDHLIDGKYGCVVYPFPESEGVYMVGLGEDQYYELYVAEIGDHYYVIGYHFYE